MLRKFDYKKHKKLLEKVPFLYESTVPHIIYAGYVLERDGISEITTQDVLYPNTFPYLFLPRNKKIWEYVHITWTTKDDIKKLSTEVNIFHKNIVGTSYNYSTDDFANLSGHKMASIRRHVNQFEKKYSYKIFHKYNKEKVKKFIKRWDSQQNDKTFTYKEGLKWFNFCIDNSNKYGIKSIFVEVDGKLVGITQGVSFDKNRWVGLHQKSDYKYKGLSRFLLHKRAQMFKDIKEFTLGTGCGGDDGVIKYKEELHPIKKTEYFYVITEGKKKPRT